MTARPTDPRRFADYGDVLTLREYAELVRFTTKVASVDLLTGAVRAYRVGHEWRIAKSSAEAWLVAGLHYTNDRAAHLAWMQARLMAAGITRPLPSPTAGERAEEADPIRRAA